MATNPTAAKPPAENRPAPHAPGREPSQATGRELMVCIAAAELKDGDVVFVGIGLPSLACNLARASHAPNLVLIYESGTIGTRPERIPLSIGDPALVTGCTMVAPMMDIFQLLLQRGHIDVGFLGAAQIDRRGNINTTVIGSYDAPRVRLPGSGGASEIAAHARRVIVVTHLDRRAFPERVDFVTSAGRRVARVITDKCIFDMRDGELMLASVFPGVDVDEVRAGVGWDLKLAPSVSVVPRPEPRMLEILAGLTRAS
jgi:glutaconate CoA-transferase, subunit B